MIFLLFPLSLFTLLLVTHGTSCIFVMFSSLFNRAFTRTRNMKTLFMLEMDAAPVRSDPFLARARPESAFTLKLLIAISRPFFTLCAFFSPFARNMHSVRMLPHCEDPHTTWSRCLCFVCDGISIPKKREDWKHDNGSAFPLP